MQVTPACQIQMSAISSESGSSPDTGDHNRSSALRLAGHVDGSVCDGCKSFLGGNKIQHRMCERTVRVTHSFVLTFFFLLVILTDKGMHVG